MSSFLRTLLAVCTAVVLAAACGTVAPSAELVAEDLVGALPQTAYVQGDALYIRYALRGGQAVLVAAWPPDEPGVASPYKVARRHVLPPGV